MGQSIDAPQLAGGFFTDLQEFGGDTVFGLARTMIQGLVALFGPLIASGESRDDLPPPVVVRTFAGLLVFRVLSDAIGFVDGSPRSDIPLSIRRDVDWVGGRRDLSEWALRQGAT